jgi:hypothetical protein
VNRRFPALLVTGILAFACAPTPPERAPLPGVDEVLDPPAQCTFLVGDPQGVLVQDVIPDSAAEGILLAGDIIIAFEDEPTPDSEALLAALSSRSDGDVVDGGKTETLDLLVEGQVLEGGQLRELVDVPRLGNVELGQPLLVGKGHHTRIRVGTSGDQEDEARRDHP